MNLTSILERVRQEINEFAATDPYQLFYANRYISSQLKSDERQVQKEFKKQLKQESHKCYYQLCHDPVFSSYDGVCVHKLDSTKPYSRDNCVLMHAECYKQFQSQEQDNLNNFEDIAPTSKIKLNVNLDNFDNIAEVKSRGEIVSSKASKRYYNSQFLYWWDISPKLKEQLNDHEVIELIKKDSGESCLLTAAEIKKHLIPGRQTSRGDGNWGIKILSDNPDCLKIEEPGKSFREWASLAVENMQTQ